MADAPEWSIERPDEPMFERAGEVLIPHRRASGPWFPGVQHGGAVAGLFARAVEAVPSAVTMHITRLTVDLTRKVPLEPTTVTTRIVRDGRRVQSVEAAMVIGGIEVSRASAIRIRTADGVVGADAVLPPWPGDEAPGDPEDAAVTALDEDAFAYLACFEMRRKADFEPGRGTVWLRLRNPLVGGESPSPIVRASMVADLTMSAGSVVGFHRYLSANPDLTVTSFRPPAGEWLALDSTVRLVGDGIGESTGAMYDRAGRFGSTLKTMLIDPR